MSGDGFQTVRAGGFDYKNSRNCRYGQGGDECIRDGAVCRKTGVYGIVILRMLLYEISHRNDENR